MRNHASVRTCMSIAVHCVVYAALYCTLNSTPAVRRLALQPEPNRVVHHFRRGFWHQQHCVTALRLPLRGNSGSSWVENYSTRVVSSRYLKGENGIMPSIGNISSECNPSSESPAHKPVAENRAKFNYPPHYPSRDCEAEFNWTLARCCRVAQPIDFT